jgi:hypothetical protein
MAKPPQDPSSVRAACLSAPTPQLHFQEPQFPLCEMGVVMLL